MSKKKREPSVYPLIINTKDMIAILKTKSLKDEAIETMLSGNIAEDAERHHVINGMDGRGSIHILEYISLYSLKNVKE